MQCHAGPYDVSNSYNQKKIAIVNVKVRNNKVEHREGVMVIV